MSHQLINHNSDLKKLRDEGYELHIVAGFILIKNVPYLTSQKEVKQGTLVSTLTLAGDKTTTPDDHQAHFLGEVPCGADGMPNTKIINSSGHRSLAAGVEIDHSFSAKPRDNGGRYSDYYEKMTTYVNILSGPAQLYQPGVTAKTFAVIPSNDSSSIFNYVDTSSSRASIGTVADKFLGHRVSIIGMGGTGSYVLDLVAKTPVDQIHLFDGDKYLQHNAFRSPGAPSVEELAQQENKAMYFARVYSKMRKGIVAHPTEVSAENVEALREMSFVFICIDDGPAKKIIVEKLDAWGVPFVDVGMGVFQVGNKLGGVLRTTLSTPRKRDHILDKKRISFSEGEANNEYNRNIQIADLNALNAAFAVIKWKKEVGFYLDLEDEHSSVYTIDGNTVTNEDHHEEESEA